MDSNMRFTNIQPLDTSQWYLYPQYIYQGSNRYKDIYVNCKTNNPLEYYTLSGAISADITPKTLFSKYVKVRSMVPESQSVRVTIRIRDAQDNLTEWTKTA